MKRKISTLIGKCLCFLFLMSTGTASMAVTCGTTNGGTITPTTSLQTISCTSGTIPYFTFSATSGVTYMFSTCGYTNTEDTKIAIYASSGDALQTSNDDNGVYCTGNTASLEWQCTTSANYYVVVSHSSCTNLSNTGNLKYGITPCSSITNITGIGSGNSQSVSFASGAGVWTAVTCSGGSAAGREMIYSFTPTTTGTYSINVSSAGGGYIDYQYKASTCASSYSGWTCIAKVLSTGTYGSMSWTAGTTYYILLEAEGTTGSPNYSQTFYIDGPTPSCTPPTASVNSPTGCGSVSITCSASGGSGGTILYKWYAGTSCSGTVLGTSSSYTASTSGNYACKAYITGYESLCYTCSYGYATVNTASTAPTSITGTSCSGSVMGTNSSYTASSSGNYACKAYITGYESSCYTCSYGYATVNTASTAPTSITGTTTICSGETSTLTASGGTEGTSCTYQWGTGSTVGSNIISGATSISYTTPALTSNTTYWVRRVDPSPCSTTTGGATVTVIILNAWNLTGNSGTNSGTNFIGTTDNTSFVFKTNNFNRMIIDHLGNVGVGTTAPSKKLDILNGCIRAIDPTNFFTGMFQGGSVNLIALGTYAGDVPVIQGYSTADVPQNITINPAGGNVGIGTTNPSQKLEIHHNDATGGIVLTHGTNDNSFKSQIRFSKEVSGIIEEKWAIGNDFDMNEHQTFFIWDNIAHSARLLIDEQGRVGLGGVRPPANGTYKLYVDGGIVARDVKVTASSTFPDFVFADDYKILSIKELEKYITSNKHLPDFPSAAEIENNGGFELGDMQTKLVKKIEEQTLYIIDLQKQINELKQTIEDVKNNK